MATGNDKDAPFAPAGAAQASAVVADLEAQSWPRPRPSLVNEAAARRLLELGMNPRDIAEWLGWRRRS